MTISAMPTVWTETGAERLSKRAIGYHRARLRGQLHQAVLREFVKAEAGGLTKKRIAVSIHKSASQVTRWISSPGNWTINTLSDLLLSMGCQLTVGVSRLMPEEKFDRRADVFEGISHQLPKMDDAKSKDLPSLGSLNPKSDPPTNLLGIQRPPQL